MAKLFFFNLIKIINPHIQEAQQTQSRMNINKTMKVMVYIVHDYIVIKYLTTSNKVTILKVAREKQIRYILRSKDKKGKKQLEISFKYYKPKILYPGKISFKNQDFIRQTKLRDNNYNQLHSFHIISII